MIKLMRRTCLNPKSRYLLLPLGVLISAAAPGRAQTYTGVIDGIVTDPSSAAVAGAKRHARQHRDRRSTHHDIRRGWPLYVFAAQSIHILASSEQARVSRLHRFGHRPECKPD